MANIHVQCVNHRDMAKTVILSTISLSSNPSKKIPTKKQVHFEEGHGGEALEKYAFSQPKQISWGWFKYCVNIYTNLYDVGECWYNCILCT